MKGDTKYLIDSNVFIQAKDDYYGFDFCPGFWASLLHFHHEGLVFTVDKVRDDIKAGNDELKRWMLNDVPSDFFRKTTNADVGLAYGRAMEWVEAQGRYTRPEKSKYAVSSDGWLVAYAVRHLGEYHVVTHELAAPDSPKVKIPDVCDAMGVRCINPFDMLRALKVRLESNFGSDG